MIQGAVRPGGSAVVTVILRGPTGATERVDAVLDTGFTAFVALPPAIVTALGLHFDSDETVVLGDGRAVVVPLYRGSIVWEGEEREISVHCTDTDPLIGVAMLWGSRLEVDFEGNGRVAISPLTNGAQ
jgi:clan AA aspartic protease